MPFGTGKHAPIAAEDQGRVIAGILEDPAPHNGKVYPLFGPVEYTYRETAQVLSRVLGKERRVQAGRLRGVQRLTAARPGGNPRILSARSGREQSDDFLFQHLREVAIDHQNGVFEGTNDLVEKLGGRPPMTLEAFIDKHRKAFE